ncbi:polysaccharide pyruvyl transferase family protein [bacterium]|nr:polysaccharide pyruvyl transferase family protein [bacterium]
MVDRLELVAALRQRLLDTLRPLLAGAGRVALLDFPNHANVGDSSIWLGELGCLRELGVRGLCYTADHGTYWPAELARRLGNGVILLHGGGNLGDLYAHHQRLRESVVAKFPDNPIVQLPQSIHFESAAALDRAGAVFKAHPRFTLLTRDTASLSIARDQLGLANSLLCPDMAFGIGPLPRPAPATQRVVWLARTDQEALPVELPTNTRPVDWLEESPTWLARWNLFLSWRLNLHRQALGWLRGPLSATYAPLARQRLDRGCRLLATGETVVTDRLHGHILCLLLGIRHYLLDNTYGKLRHFHETWTRDCGLGRYCGTPSRLPEAEL